jgi:hypothetical protein
MSSSDSSSNYGNRANSWRFFPEAAAAREAEEAEMAEIVRLSRVAADHLAELEDEEDWRREVEADELAAHEARLNEAAADAAWRRDLAEHMPGILRHCGELMGSPWRPPPPPALDEGGVKGNAMASAARPAKGKAAGKGTDQGKTLGVFTGKGKDKAVADAALSAKGKASGKGTHKGPSKGNDKGEAAGKDQSKGSGLSGPVLSNDMAMVAAWFQDGMRYQYQEHVPASSSGQGSGCSGSSMGIGMGKAAGKDQSKGSS